MDERRSIAKFNGVPCVGIGIQKQSGTNTVEVVDRIHAELEKIRKTLPTGMELNVAADQSVFIKRSIAEVQKHIILGSLFAVFAVFLFLGNVDDAISALALPVRSSRPGPDPCVRLHLQQHDPYGALCPWLLIDDAIIVIENIHRHIGG